MTARVVVPHLDDVGCSRGSIVAYDDLATAGLVRSGSVIVPSPLFPDVAALARLRPHLDLGVHLALTSESEAFRWGPLTDGEGLRDGDGFLWPGTTELRRNAAPGVVRAEMGAQIDAALAAGIDVSHLDHHMGAALAPEYLAGTVRLAREYGIPVLLPADLATYYRDVEIDAPAPDVTGVRAELAAERLLVGDHFSMGYNDRHRPCREVYEERIAACPPGVTYLSLHCSAPGDITGVHPESAAWRVAEYELFGDPDFADWVRASGVRVSSVRDHRPATGDG